MTAGWSDAADRSEVNYRAKRLSSITFQRFFCVTLDIRSTLAAAAVNVPTESTESTMATRTRTRAVQLLPIEQCLDLYFAEEVL